MRKLIIALAAALCAPPAMATQKAPSALTTEVNTLLPTNTSGQISASSLRSVLFDFIDSYADRNCSQFSALSGVITTNGATCVTHFNSAPFVWPGASGFLYCDGVHNCTWSVSSAIIPNPGPATQGGVFSHTAVASNFLTSINVDGTASAAQPAFTDISGTIAAAQLPVPTTTTLGGVKEIVPVATFYMTGIDATGTPVRAQPTFSDLGGTLAAAQVPAPTALSLGGVNSYTSPANQFITTISVAGAISSAQPAIGGISGLGAGVATALGNSAGAAGGFATYNQLGASALLGVGAGLSSSGGNIILNVGNSNTWSVAQTFDADVTHGAVSTTTGNIKLANSASASLLTVHAGNNAGAWTLTLPTGPGAAGQVLQTDGAGVTSWVPQGGGGGAGTPAGAVGTLQYNAGGGNFGAVTSSVVTGSAVDIVGALTLGTQTSAQGSLVLANTAAGANPLTLQSANTTTAWTATFPPTAGTNGQVLTTNGTGTLSWSSPSGGAVSSVGLSMPAIFTVTNSPVTGAGTLTATLNNENINTVFAGPASGIAAAPTFRTLVGADLPNPAPTTLGGVKSLALVSHNFLTQIGVDGSVLQAQPVIADIAGLGSGVPAALATSTNSVGGLVTYNGAIGSASGASLTLGIQSSSTGTLVLANPTAGANPVTVQSQTGTTAYTLSLPTTAGSNGQVLTTNGSGTTTWTTPSGGGGGGTGPLFRALLTNNSASSCVPIASGGALVPLDTVSGAYGGFDSASRFNATTGFYTPNVSGYYQVNWTVFVTGISTGNLTAYLLKNGTLIAGGSGSPSGNSSGSDIVFLNGTTDYIGLYFACPSGNFPTLLGVTGGSPGQTTVLSAHWAHS